MLPTLTAAAAQHSTRFGSHLVDLTDAANPFVDGNAAFADDAGGSDGG